LDEEKALPPRETEDQEPFHITSEQDAAFRAVAEPDAIPLESYATVLHFEAAWDLLPHLQLHPLKEHRGHFEVMRIRSGNWSRPLNGSGEHISITSGSRLKNTFGRLSNGAPTTTCNISWANEKSY
jgi:hypothetical protein